jgi:hypothetical protein
MGPQISTARRTSAEVKNWVEQITTANRIDLQQKIIDFLLKAYAGLLTATMLVFFLQGFKLWGFNLESSLLKWLGGATIGQIVGLLTLTFGAVFKGSKNRSL